MINLIKNELLKIFRRKIIYYFIAIVLLVNILPNISEKLTYSRVEQIYLTQENDKYEQVKIDINNIEKNKEEVSITNEEYINLKARYESFEEIKKYKVFSWQREYLSSDENFITISECYVKYKYFNDETQKNCQTKYNEIINSVNKNNYKYIDLQAKENLNNSLNENNFLLSVSTDKKAQEVIKDNIKKDEEKLKVINYRLKNNITPSDEFYFITKEYINKIDNLDYNDVFSVSEYNIYKYKFENKIVNNSKKNMIGLNNQESIISTISSISSLVLIFTIALNLIMSDEYSKGTIKQLLVKPHKRSKILLSKFISLLIAATIFIILEYVISIIVIGIFYGFDGMFSPVVVYNFSTSLTSEINFFVYIFLYFIAKLPILIIIIILGLLFSILAGNSAIPIILSYLVDLAASIIFSISTNYNIKFLTYFPTNSWNFSCYLFGGKSEIKGLNFGISILIVIITITVLYTITDLVFRKKDIKNV